MRPATLRQLIVLSIAVALSATACYQPLRGPVDVPDVLDPRSPQATLIANFFWFLLAVMTLVSVGVIAALLLFYYRFRARPGREQGQHILGNRRLEIAWTAAPAILLVGVFLYELQAISMLEAPPPTVDDANGEPLRVVAVGQEWWWEFQLPDLGVTTANELHLPVGRPVEVELRAERVLHSFWVPQLHGKRDMIPGRTNVLTFVPTHEGVYAGLCTEFCGVQHAWMRFRVFVESPEEFAAWVQRQSQPALVPETPSPLVARGREVYLEKGCQSCHVIRGLGGVPVGPDLTHVASRTILAAGVLDMSPENMARWLRNPQEVKPGNLMPGVDFTEEELEALVAYMMSLE